jgi:hypothetical protein
MKRSCAGKKNGEGCCGGLKWVGCDRCSGWEQFENTGIGGEYDSERVEQANFVCRLCRMEERAAATEKERMEWMKEHENAMKLLSERIASIEVKLGDVGLLKRMVDEVDSRLVIQESAVSDKLKDMSEENESKFTVSEMRTDDKLGVLGIRVDELGNRTAAFELKLADMAEEWPTPREAVTKEENLKNERRLSRTGSENMIKKPSFEEKYKDKSKDTIMLVGDSLTRGVGSKLERQSHMVTTLSQGGARIEHITGQISKLGSREDRHLVVLVGTNNIEREGNIGIMDKYRKLLEECGKVSNRKVSLIGIPRRSDLGSYEDSRRIGVNLWLEELCSEFGAGFLAWEPRDNMLARDGLHLNEAGQDALGREIFRHCKTFLG